MSHPTHIRDLEKELLQHAQDGRSDAGFRLNIALAQLGTLAAHFTHDLEENPIARPYGTPESEKAAIGHAILQIMTYGALRLKDKASIQDAMNLALDNLRDQDFIANSTKDQLKYETAKNILADLKGDVAFFPENTRKIIVGPVFVDPYGDKLAEMPASGCVLVSSSLNDKLSAHIHKCKAIITDNGGITSHVAIIAREYKVPCVVGTKYATHRITPGSMVNMYNNGEIHL
jgi:phosphohistidine swiveling domain-containing protein